MRKNYFFSAVIFLMFFSFCSWAQKTPDLDKIPPKFIDPEFPKYSNTGDKAHDLGVFVKAKKNYFEKHTLFPDYPNTGNAIDDSVLYKKLISDWLKLNPFFPVYAETKDKKADDERYFQAKTAWINEFPEKYKEIIDEIYNTAEIIETNQTTKTTNTTDFPVMQKTGNEFMDIENYHQAKNNWLKNNPEELTKEEISERNLDFEKTKNTNIKKVASKQ